MLKVAGTIFMECKRGQVSGRQEGFRIRREKQRKREREKHRRREKQKERERKRKRDRREHEGTTPEQDGGTAPTSREQTPLV